MKIELSFDDGAVQDLRLAEILKKYGMNAIFYIPNGHELSRDNVILLSRNFEIGGHTVTHPMDMKLLSPEDLEFEIEDNRDYLRHLTGQKIESFCYPRGRYNSDVIEAVKKAGYKNARTTKVLQTSLPTLDFERGTSVHVFDRIEYKDDWVGTAIQQLSMAIVKEKKDGNGYFHLWGHSWEIEKNNQWSEFESFISYLARYI